MPFLQCRQLNKSFDGIHALHDFTAAIEKATITAIIGPNGAGKSTLLNLLTGFMRPDSGQCAFEDREIIGLPAHKISRLGITRTFQDLRLNAQVSVIENVLLAIPNQIGERFVPALTRIGTKQGEEWSQVLATHVLELVGAEFGTEEIAGNLSFGQQKLLSLACCLATQPKLILLDEPIGGIDPGLAVRVIALLRRLRTAGTTVIFVEHDITSVREAADRVIVLDHGRIVADGVPGSVLNSAEIAEAYLD